MTLYLARRAQPPDQSQYYRCWQFADQFEPAVKVVGPLSLLFYRFRRVAFNSSSFGELHWKESHAHI